MRPSAATAPAAGDHLNAPRRRGLRVKRNIKSRHKPISKSRDQTRRSATQIKGASVTPLTMLQPKESPTHWIVDALYSENVARCRPASELGRPPPRALIYRSSI